MTKKTAMNRFFHYACNADEPLAEYCDQFNSMEKEVVRKDNNLLDKYYHFPIIMKKHNNNDNKHVVDDKIDDNDDNEVVYDKSGNKF